jgi:hypothetical protein
MKRPVGRPKTLHGPIVTVKLPAIVSIQVNALAKVKEQSVSQVIRSAVTDAMKKEWGGEQ